MEKSDIKNYLKNIKVIGFDADDTLWVNETYFREAENNFCKLMSNFETENKVQQELLKVEMDNLSIYGYGIKGFVLSMMECALTLSNGQLDNKVQKLILEIGKEMLNKPVELIPSIKENLDYFSKNYRLLMLTKGDLLDQERKLEKSGLSKYFHHVEVLSDKQPKNYNDLLEHLKVNPNEFLMIGNSLKSDVLPLLEIEAKAVHVPFHITWEHEKVNEIKSNNFITVESVTELKDYL